MSSQAPELLWTPDPQRARESAIASFTRFVNERYGVQISDSPSKDPGRRGPGAGPHHGNTAQPGGPSPIHRPRPTL